jgi:copper chaperone CopZ
MDNIKELILNVEGMHCSGCENRIQKAVSLVDGVKEVKANHETGKVIVNYEENTNIEEIKNAILDLDFKII